MEGKSIFDSFTIISTKIKFYRACLKEDEEGMKELTSMFYKKIFETIRGSIKISKNNTHFIGLVVNYDMSKENLDDIKSRFQNGKDGSLLESNFKNVHAVISGDFYEDANSHQFSPRGKGEFPGDTMCIFFYCCPNN